jgi:hypothetical protein
MPGFYLVNEKRFPLPVNVALANGEENVNVDLLPYYRWEHRVTIGYQGKRYMIFLDNLKQMAYVEDCTHSLKKIEDQSLWRALVQFAQSQGYLNIMPPMVKNKEERFV